MALVILTGLLLKTPTRVLASWRKRPLAFCAFSVVCEPHKFIFLFCFLFIFYFIIIIFSSALRFVTGVIPRDKRVLFERILWRALRGNLFMKQEEIEDPISDPITVILHLLLFLYFSLFDEFLILPCSCFPRI